MNFIKLKYFRLSNNIVLLEDIITKITNYQLLNLREFKLSITQIDKDLAVSEMTICNSRYDYNKIN